VQFRRLHGTPASEVGRAGLEPATNGFAKGPSRSNQLITIYPCATTRLADNQIYRELEYFHRFSFIGGEYSVTHVSRDVTVVLS
jgi:hypothetical protein